MMSQQLALHNRVIDMHQDTQRNDELLARNLARERAENSKWRTDIIEAILESRWQVPLDESMTLGGNLLGASKVKYFQDLILNQLWFASLPDRQERIAKAYRKTFRWIFHTPKGDTKPWTNFAEWLQNGQGIYWISGKAGSGKSTLFKYLWAHPRTCEYLERWSGSQPLRVAHYFFWNSGDEMQMSENGLLQSLLHRLLSQDPDLIPRLFPQRWTSYNLVGEHSLPWRRTELLQALRNLVIEEELPFKIFFCIDGLDEFNGDHTELVNLFKDMALSSNVKFCVSSRPLLQFQDAFGSGPKLVLQDLTYPDIELFVNSKLCENSRFKELRQRQPEHASKFRSEIALKASGVFLWVDLVVRSLLQGLSNSDRISDLRKRLRTLPNDLENLYQGLFNSIEPFYFDQAAQFFQIYQAAQGQLSLLSFSFADENNIQFALQANIQPLNAMDKRFRCEEMLRRLNSRCRGFLEVSMENTRRRSGHTKRTSHSHDSRDSQDFESNEDDEIEFPYDSDSARSTSSTLETDKPLPPLPPAPSSSAEMQEIDTDVLTSLKVQYLHRSARDFLEKPEIWDRITAATKGHFDPHLSLCGMHVLHLKTLEPDEALTSKLWKTTISCLVHLGEVHAATEELETSLIDQLEFAMQHHGNIADFKIYLPAIAVKFGIHKYVQANLIRGTFPFIDQVGEPLLDIAILHQRNISGLEEIAGTLQTTARRQPPLPDMTIAKLLLEHGADPNQRYDGSTPWINLFTQAAVRRPFSPAYGLELKKRWLDGIEMFLRHGADPAAREEIASGRALRAAFRYSDEARVAELEALLREKLEPQRAQLEPQHAQREAQGWKLTLGPLVCAPLGCFA